MTGVLYGGVQGWVAQKAYYCNYFSQTGGRLVLKPTRKQVEGGFLGTLASIGIPMEISLVSKMFGGGLQVDKAPSTKKK